MSYKVLCLQTIKQFRDSLDAVLESASHATGASTTAEIDAAIAQEASKAASIGDVR